jgi:AcrR family transcriptional regulator
MAHFFAHRSLSTRIAGQEPYGGAAREDAMAGKRKDTEMDERRDVIVAAALAIAAEDGWEQVRLSAIAERTGIPLVSIADRFRDVDALANAWFAEARLAVFAVPFASLDEQPADVRLAVVLEAWLDHLQPERVIAIDIIRAKLHPSHPHHWVPLVFDLSRLVHDFLDAARIPGRPPLRPAQEVVLTAITLAMLADWAADDSDAAATTKRRLRRRLAGVGALVGRFSRGSS